MAFNNITEKELTKTFFMEKILKEGFVVVEEVLDEDFMIKVKSYLEQSIEKEAEYHGGKDYKEYGMLLCAPIYGGPFLEIADNQKLMQPFDWALGDTSIIYVYTSSCLPPKGKNHASRIHVDRPHFTGDFLESLGCLIMLDDFTEENGATWILPKSHLSKEAPDEKFFYQNAIRVTAPKGSVFYFHLRLWHAGGVNMTDNWRHSIGIGMVRGFIKQRIDIPGALINGKTDYSFVSEYGLQKLGFHSIPPKSLEEFYGRGVSKSYIQKSEWEED